MAKPRFKPLAGQEYAVKFLNPDKPFENPAKGNFSKNWGYYVSVDGGEIDGGEKIGWYIYSEPLHNIIQSCGIKPNEVAVVKKRQELGADPDRPYDVYDLLYGGKTYSTGKAEDNGLQQDYNEEHPPPISDADSPDAPQKQEPVDGLKDDMRQMRECFADALHVITLINDPDDPLTSFKAEDVRAAGISLFIERNRNGR